MRKLLLGCGIASSFLYLVMTTAVAMMWDDYSSASQTISELSAIGAPTRQVWLIPGALYTVLVTAFGVGVWHSAAHGPIRRAGALIAAYGALGLIWPFAPMHLRPTLAAGGGTLSDTVHLVLASVTVVLMLAAMISASGAFDRPFRGYSMASLVVLAACGGLTFLEAPNVGANLPTPWIGIWERINLGVFLLWVIVVAVKLWPDAASNRLGAGSGNRQPATPLLRAS